MAYLRGDICQSLWAHCLLLAVARRAENHSLVYMFTDTYSSAWLKHLLGIKDVGVYSELNGNSLFFILHLGGKGTQLSQSALLISKSLKENDHWLIMECICLENLRTNLFSQFLWNIKSRLSPSFECACAESRAATGTVLCTGQLQGWTQDEHPAELPENLVWLRKWILHIETGQDGNF